MKQYHGKKKEDRMEKLGSGMKDAVVKAYLRASNACCAFEVQRKLPFLIILVKRAAIEAYLLTNHQ